MEDEGLPSGKRSHSELERSTMFIGQTHYFDWAIFQIYNELPEGSEEM